MELCLAAEQLPGAQVLMRFGNQAVLGLGKGDIVIETDMGEEWGG